MKRSDPHLVGERMRKVRALYDLSQKGLAEAGGVTPAAVGNWEQGRSRPTLHQADIICTKYAVTMDYLFRGDLGSLRHDVATRLEALDGRAA